MPFQSEKQRRYLWANEPEIARDWADTYGSRIQNNTGGINRLGFDKGSTGFSGTFDEWRAQNPSREELLAGVEPNFNLFNYIKPRASLIKSSETPVEGIGVDIEDRSYGIGGMYPGDNFYVGGDLQKGNVKVNVQKDGETIYVDSMPKDDLQKLYLGLGEKRGDHVEVGTDGQGNYTLNIIKSFADGGIMSMQGGVKNYLGDQEMVHAPKHWQSAPDHPETELAYITKPEKDLLVKSDLHDSLKGGVNRGPSGIMSLNGWGSSDDSQNRAGADISAGMDKSGSDAGWSSPGGGGGQYNTAMSGPQLGLLAGQKGSSTVMPASFYGKEYKPQGFFGNLKDKIFQGRGDYETQVDWENAKKERIGQKRIDRILNRSDEFPITEDTYKNLMDAGWTGGLPTLGSTATSRGDRNTYEGIRSIDVPQDNLVDIAQSVTTNQADNDYWNALNMKPVHAAYIKPEFIQEQEWYNSPLKLKTNLSGMVDPEVETFKSHIKGGLTIEKYLDLSKKGLIPDSQKATFEKQVLKAIKEQGGFGDTFPKNYSLGNIKPEFKDGRLNIDETKIDDDYKERLKYLEGWT
jgi:hypothetical protein